MSPKHFFNTFLIGKVTKPVSRRALVPFHDSYWSAFIAKLSFTFTQSTQHPEFVKKNPAAPCNLLVSTFISLQTITSGENNSHINMIQFCISSCRHWSSLSSRGVVLSLQSISSALPWPIDFTWITCPLAEH